MTDPLLTTKLHLPILRKDIVPRGRLVERLNAGLWQKDGFVRNLTLVSAPAGFGKTTLASEWLFDFRFQIFDFGLQSGGIADQESKIGNRVAWLSLDEGDNDPARFLAYLIAAVRQIQPEFGGQTGGILQLPQPPPPHVILTSLINELSSLPAPFILALDDYHAIHTPLIHEQLTFILDHQPAIMHLVILTREDPLLPIARLRARGQLLEIRQEDLRFTRNETAEFLKIETGLFLNSSDIAALEQHTEGWAAGLQLAALSLRDRDDQAAFIHDFSAGDRFILDYLLDEVFKRLPVELQDFLLQTSILKRLSGPLCDAVMKRDGSSKMLRSLEQSNLFIIPLDTPHTWYRYHHLFAELLHQRLRLSNIPETDLHQRASQWYEAQDLLSEAIDHILLAQDWGEAARLIGIINESMLKRGEVVTLLNWCDRLPKKVIYSSPELCLIQAWAALVTSQFEIAALALEAVEQMAPPGSTLLGQVAAAQAFMARAKRENARAIEKSELALALLPETELAIRGNIAMNLGLIYWHEGLMAEAETVLLQASDLCSKAENHFALLTTQIFLARIPAVQGKLHQAAVMCEKLIQQGGQVPILCLAHYDLATIHLEWNDLPKALEHLEKGFALGQRSGNIEFQQAGHLLRAILAHANGDESGALEALTAADAMAHDFPAVIHSRTSALGVQLALARNDQEMLAQWSTQVTAEVDAHSFYRFMGLTKARLLTAQGKKGEAAVVLAALYEKTFSAGWGYGMLVVRILQSLTAKTGNESAGFIDEALRIGQPEGFIHSFVEAGSPIIPILQEAARRGIASDYAGQILAALGVERHLAPAGQGKLVEPLSRREMEVLRLVSSGLSNREIALKLVISPGTAKTHIHHLCGKMGVRNRTEAAIKAKELQLV